MKTIQLTNWKTMLKNAPKKESDALINSAIASNHCMKTNHKNGFPSGSAIRQSLTAPTNGR